MGSPGSAVGVPGLLEIAGRPSGGSNGGREPAEAIVDEGSEVSVDIGDGQRLAKGDRPSPRSRGAKPTSVASGLGLRDAAGRSGGLVLGLAGELAVRVQTRPRVSVLAVGLVAHTVESSEAAVQNPDGAAKVV